MAQSIDTFIQNILSVANTLAMQSSAAINTGASLADQTPSVVGLVQVDYPDNGDVSELTGLPAPVNSDITDTLNGMIGDIANLYDQYFPDYADQIAALVRVAVRFGNILTDEDYLTRDVDAELALIVNEQNEQDRLLYRTMAENYARRGFILPPGMLRRETTDTYQTRARQMLAKKFDLIEEGVGEVAEQHKIALNELLTASSKSRAIAINASSALIAAAAKQSALPSKNYAAMVDIKSAMADAILAKYSADKVLNERLARVYSGNLEIKSAIDRYNANMHQTQVGNITSLAVAKAENIGKEAGALWNAINVIASASTISFE